jgi:hypothetical protein
MDERGCVRARELPHPTHRNRACARKRQDVAYRITPHGVDVECCFNFLGTYDPGWKNATAMRLIGSALVLAFALNLPVTEAASSSSVIGRYDVDLPLHEGDEQ